MTDFNALPHNGPKIIGLSGYATAGKDATADVLTRLYGYKRIGFADGLKEFTRVINPIIHGEDVQVGGYRVSDLVDDFGDVAAKKNPEYRRLLQVVGTEGVRHFFGDDAWINLAFKKAGSDYTVISDVRFPNEAQAIKDRGGVVMRVVRPGVTAQSDHPSETSMNDWEFDYTVNNDGSLVDLEGEVQWLMGAFG